MQNIWSLLAVAFVLGCAILVNSSPVTTTPPSSSPSNSSTSVELMDGVPASEIVFDESGSGMEALANEDNAGTTETSDSTTSDDEPQQTTTSPCGNDIDCSPYADNIIELGISHDENKSDNTIDNHVAGTTPASIQKDE